MSRDKRTPTAPDVEDRHDPQPDLFSPIEPEPRAELTDQEWAALSPSERFERFHTENPLVYRTIVAKAREWRAAGNGKVGMSLLYGMVRWVLALETKGDPYRVNDHYQAYYARLVMWLEPDLADIFDTRRSPDADAWIASLKAKAA